MKKIIILVISIFIFGCNAKENIKIEYLFQVNQDVNLREKPSTKSKIIDVLRQNETVQLVDSLNNWYSVIDYDLNNGYVSKKYIDRISNVKIIKEETFINENVIYIIAGVILLMIFWVLKRRSKIKKEQDLRKKEQAKREAKRKVRLAALELKKQEEDKKLEIEKNVTCDDGVVRNYNGFMYGIIRQQDEDIIVSSIICDEQKNKDRKKNRTLTNLNTKIENFNSIFGSVNVNDFPFDKEIQNHKWFSENGIALKSEEILAKQKEYFLLKRNYEERYRELRGWSRSNPRRVDKNYLCCVNNTFFHAGAFSKLPHKLFSGLIDGSRFVNGILELPNKNEQEIEDCYLSMNEKIKSFDRDEDLGYWFKINIDSVDNPISVAARKVRGYSKEQEMSQFLWGHDEEYELKMQGYSLEDKKEFISMRIISFGALLGFYDEIIEKLNSLSKRENIDLNERIDRLELELAHCKARLYGSIKFALRNNISKKLIKDWYYNFEDNDKLYVGSNPMDI